MLPKPKGELARQSTLAHQATHSVEDCGRHVAARVEVIIRPQLADVVVHATHKEERDHKTQEFVVWHFQMVLEHAVDVARRVTM